MNFPTQAEIEAINPKLDASYPFENRRISMKLKEGKTMTAHISLSKTGKRFKCFKRYVNETKTDWIHETTYVKNWQAWVKNL